MRVRLWGVRGSLATPMSAAQLREKTRALLAEASPADLVSPQAIDAYLDRTSRSCDPRRTASSIGSPSSRIRCW